MSFGNIFWKPFNWATSATYKALKFTFKKHPLFIFDALWGLDMYKNYAQKFQERLTKLGSNEALDTALKLTLLGSGIIGLSAALSELIRRKQLEDKAVEAFQMVVKKDPYLQEVPEEELVQYFEAIRAASPTIAANPITLRTALRQMATYGGIDIPTLEAMTKVEANKAKAYDLRKALLDFSDRIKSIAEAGMSED